MFLKQEQPSPRNDRDYTPPVRYKCYFQEIETWVTALAHYDNNEFDEALAQFSQIADTSKILFNMGIIHATLGGHEKAVRFLFGK